MKKLRYIILTAIMVCLLIVLAIPAGANSYDPETGDVTINDGITSCEEGYVGVYGVRGLFKSYYPLFTTNDPITFNLNTEFSKPTTTYSDSVARLSCAIAAIMMTNNRGDTYSCLIKSMFPWETDTAFSTFQYNCPKEADWNADYESYTTGEYITTTTITRNGHDCRLILIAFNEVTTGTYATCVSDLLLSDELTANMSDTERSNFYANADDLYSITLAADFSFNYNDKFAEYIPEDGGDYLFWLVGELRGGSIANDLASQLIDTYGTEHVVCYTFGTLHNSKNALTSDQTSKYNSIFYIVNSDDALTELPLGTQYSGWGYKNWGTQIQLGFKDTGNGNVTTTAFYTKLNKAYHNYILDIQDDADAYGSVYPAYDYAVYSNQNYSGSPNGESIQTLYSYMHRLLPTIESYYEKELTVYTYLKISKTYDSLYDYLKQYIALLSDADDNNFLKSILSLFGELVYTSDYEGCDLHNLLHYGVNYGLHYSKASEIIKLKELTTFIETAKVPLYEAVTATQPEAYLAWMSIDNPREGFLTTLPEDKETTKSELSSNGVTVSGEKTFYADQGFTATAVKDGYKLTFGYVSGSSLNDGEALTVCNPYGQVTLTVPAPDSVTTDCQASYNGEIIDMTYSDGTLSAKVDTLNGTLKILRSVTLSANSNAGTVTVKNIDTTTVATCHVLLARYDAAGKLTGAISAEVDVGADSVDFPYTETAGETVKVFLLGDNWNPTYKALSLENT